MHESSTVGIQIYIRETLVAVPAQTRQEIHAAVAPRFPRDLGRKEVKKTLWRMLESGQVRLVAGRYVLQGA